MQIVIFNEFNQLDRPLILDDIERCKIDGKELFGFLQTYQEKIKQPIVIVGDEDRFSEIFNLTQKEYFEIKEKTIGRTLVKHANIEETISHFLKTLKAQIDGELYSQLRKICIEIFEYMSYVLDEEKKTHENMRAFQIAIREAAYYYDNLDKKYKMHNEFSVRFLKVAIALQYAVQVGRFTNNNWHTIKDEKESDVGRFKKTIVEDFLLKFGENSFEFQNIHPILPVNTWRMLIFGDFIDWEFINRELMTSCGYFSQETQKSFEKLFSFQTKTKVENEAALMELEADLENNRITNLGDIFAAFSIRAAILKTQEFVLKNDISHQIKELREKFDTYIDRLLKREILELDERDTRTRHYLEARSELRTLLPNLDEVYQSIKMRYLAKKYSKLVEEALQDASNDKMLKLRTVLTVECRETPLFIQNEYITLAKFKELIEKLTLPNVDYLKRCLYERYQLGVSKQKDFFITFLPEKDTFIEIEKFLSDRIDHLKDKDIYRAYNYMRLRDDIQQILDRMDEYQKEYSMKVSQQ